MSKKKYSVKQRYKYHLNRMFDQNASASARVYSRHWIDGYNDPFPNGNFQAVCTEIDYKRKKGRKIIKEEAPMLFGYKNGLSAQLEEINKSVKRQ